MTDDELDSRIGLSGAREMAERQLLAMLRDPGEPIDLRITYRAGTWAIQIDKGAAFASGKSFAEAWHHIAPVLAITSNDNEKEA